MRFVSEVSSLGANSLGIREIPTFLMGLPRNVFLMAMTSAVFFMFILTGLGIYSETLIVLVATWAIFLAARERPDDKNLRWAARGVAVAAAAAVVASLLYLLRDSFAIDYVAGNERQIITVGVFAEVLVVLGGIFAVRALGNKQEGSVALLALLPTAGLVFHVIFNGGAFIALAFDAVTFELWVAILSGVANAMVSLAALLAVARGVAGAWRARSRPGMAVA